MLNLSHLIVPGENIPEGWTRHYDSNQRIYYYHNEYTNQSQWEKPNQPAINNMPPSSLQSLSNKKSYYSDEDDDDNVIYSNNIKSKHDRKKEKSNKKKDKKSKKKVYYSDDDDNDSDNHDNSQISNSKSLNYLSIINHMSYSDMDDDENENNINKHTTNNTNYEDLSLYDPSRDIIVGGNYKRESQSYTTKHGHTNQDYLYLAQLYRIHCHYTNPSNLMKCVLCQINISTHTFFPCDHRCVCSSCIDKEYIYEYSRVMNEDLESSSDTSIKIHYNCPLCGNIIKKMYKCEENGEEREKYMQWCYEVVPPLDKKFISRFKHAGEALEEVYIRRDSKYNSTTCLIS